LVRRNLSQFVAILRHFVDVTTLTAAVGKRSGLTARLKNLNLTPVAVIYF
jgi:hypothetical protein